jgi:hypothetical protein
LQKACLLKEIFVAAPLAGSLVSLTGQPLARRTARCIARLFLPPTSCPPRRSLRRLFLSLADILPAVELAVSFVSFSADVLPAAPLAESLISFS